MGIADLVATGLRSAWYDRRQADAKYANNVQITSTHGCEDRSTDDGPFGCGSKNRYQNGTLVSGNMDQTLSNPPCLILSHGHLAGSDVRLMVPLQDCGCQNKESLATLTLHAH